VFAAVEQDHRQPVAELGSQRAVAFRRFGIDVGGRQVEVEFFGELLELRVDPVADRAASAGLCGGSSVQCCSSVHLQRFWMVSPVALIPSDGVPIYRRTD
jgi:hypothetical protein